VIGEAADEVADVIEANLDSGMAPDVQNESLSKATFAG
jgi:hypothetical protein